MATGVVEGERLRDRTRIKFGIRNSEFGIRNSELSARGGDQSIGACYPRLGALTGRAVPDNLGCVGAGATHPVESQTLSGGALSGSATTEGRVTYQEREPRSLGTRADRRCLTPASRRQSSMTRRSSARRRAWHSRGAECR